MGNLNHKVSLYGAVPVEVGNEEIVNLTGSATILEKGGMKFLIDLGLFQGGEGSELFNKQNIDFLNDIDGVAISHAHIDHIGRLPLLYKYGYKGPIFMTSSTKDIVLEMLLDSLKIQEEEKIERLNRNKKLGNRLKEAFKIKKYVLSLKKSGLCSEERKSIKDYLIGKLGNNYNEKDILAQIDLYFDFYNIKDESDIKGVIDSLRENLFREEDINGVVGLIQTIDPGEEKIISSKQLNPKNENAENQELLDSLPEKVARGFNGKVEVGFKSEKRVLKQKWEKRLKQEINKAITGRETFEVEKEELRKSLEAALTFYLQYSFIYNELNPIQPNYQNKLNFDRDPNFSGIKKQIKKNKKLLIRYGIKTRDDIERLIEDTEKIVDILSINIPFNSDDIKKAHSLLELNNISDKRRHVIGLTAVEAAHVVGSASIMFMSGIMQNRVNQLLDISGDSIGVYFSGDLGRMEGNRLGKPELPPYPVNYLQTETTYGGRDHRNKRESIDDLVNSIEGSKGNVLISVFSQQRLQEILLTILEEKIKSGTEFLDHEILVDAPLGEKLTNIYFKHYGEIFDLLSTKAQIEFFGKQVFRFLGEEEWNEIYSAKNKGKKHIILASSGMMDGGAIMNHLPCILQDSDATLLAPGYLSKGTIGHQIVMAGDSQVTIGGESYSVKCNKKFIDGFSSHISHTEILQFITETIKEGKLKSGATIALTHGNRQGQESLKSDIEEILEFFERKDIIVTIPKLFSHYDIVNRKHSQESSENILIVEPPTSKTCIVPNFLLGFKPEVEVKEPQLTEQDKKKRVVNFRRITQIKNLETGFKSRKDFFIKKSLLEKLKKSGAELSRQMIKISRLSGWQQKIFSDTITKKINRNRELSNHISSLRDRKKIIKQVLGDMQAFLSTEIQLLSQGLIDCEYNSSSLDKRIKDLNKQFEDFKKENPEKNEENSSSWNYYVKSIKNRKRDLALNKEKYKELQAELVRIKYDFKRQLISVLPNTKHLELFKILDDLWKSNGQNIFLELRQLCTDEIKNVISDIILAEGELKSHITIHLKKRKENFKGRNLYSELFGNGKNLDIEKLKSFLDSGMFFTSDLSFIQEQLDIIRLDTSKKDKQKAESNLKKYFKNKSNENKDLGVDVSVSIDELNVKFLKLLSVIFNKDYFDNYISVQFDIYLFLKSKKDFKKYIGEKYDLNNLKGITEDLEKYNKIIRELDYLRNVLDGLIDLNEQAQNIESIEEIAFGIHCTKIEFENAISKFHKN